MGGASPSRLFRAAPPPPGEARLASLREAGCLSSLPGALLDGVGNPARDGRGKNRAPRKKVGFPFTELWTKDSP